jgi:hypothetical protein
MCWQGHLRSDCPSRSNHCALIDKNEVVVTIESKNCDIITPPCEVVTSDSNVIHIEQNDNCIAVCEGDAPEILEILQL